MGSRSRTRLATLLAAIFLGQGAFAPPVRAGLMSWLDRGQHRKAAGRSLFAWLHRREHRSAAPGRCNPGPRHDQPERPMTPEEVDRLVTAQRRTTFERSFFPGD